MHNCRQCAVQLSTVYLRSNACDSSFTFAKNNTSLLLRVIRVTSVDTAADTIYGVHSIACENPENYFLCKQIQGIERHSCQISAQLQMCCA